MHDGNGREREEHWNHPDYRYMKNYLNQIIILHHIQKIKRSLGKI